MVNCEVNSPHIPHVWFSHTVNVIEMTVEEPLSDDEDGVPHSVSSSESESENDSD